VTTFAGRGKVERALLRLASGRLATGLSRYWGDGDGSGRTSRAESGWESVDGVGAQGCSTLWDGEHSEQPFDARESGAVAVLAEGVGPVRLEDVEGEAAQADEHAGVGADARLWRER
jgi:hypothetical protein